MLVVETSLETWKYVILSNSKCWVINSVMYGTLERECHTRCNEIFHKITTISNLFIFPRFISQKLS